MKYIDKAIKKELKKLIKEAVPNPIKDAEDTLKNNEEEINRLNDYIKKDTATEKMSSLDSQNLARQATQPIPDANLKKSITTQNIVAKKKATDFKDRVEQEKKDLETAQQNLKNNTIKLNFAKKGVTIPGAAPAANTRTEEVTESQDKTSFPMLKRNFFTEQDEELKSNFPPIEGSNNKVYLVKFDKNTQQPFDVKFTKRGFSIEGTRLGFETIENALSKNYVITLGGGKGFVLNPIRMQQILKYKDKWF